MNPYIRISDKNLRNSYWAKRENGFQILSPISNNYINLYCEIKKNKLISAIEVEEDIVTKNEKILAVFGDYKKVANYYLINL